MKDPHRSELLLCGCNVSSFSPITRLVALALAMMTSQLMHGIFTEHVSQGVLARLTWSSAAIELSVYTILAACELKIGHERVALSSCCLPQYCLIALFISLGRGLTWVAYASVSFPTVVVFKSSKILIVMISSLFILHKKFKPLQYVAGLLAVAGLYLISSASGQSAAKRHALDSGAGIAVACLATVLEGVVSNLQERVLRGGQGSLVEMLLVTNGLGSLLLYGVAAANGELRVFKDEIGRRPPSLLWLLVTVVLAYGYETLENYVAQLWRAREKGRVREGVRE